MQTLRSGAGRGRLESWARIGGLPTDSAEESLQKATLVLFAVLTVLVAFAWVGTYTALGLYRSAAIPFAYQLISVVNLAVLARTKRYRFFRNCALSLALVLPFLLQLSLGGFFPSSGIVLWSFSAPLGALLFAPREHTARWFAAFVAAVALAAALDRLLANPAEIPRGVEIAFFALNIVGVTGTAYFLLRYFLGERDRAAALIAIERERSERLLLNVLPESIAERLKAGESPIADRMPDVGVLFADIVGFTPLAEAIRPDELIRFLDDVFTRFDALVTGHGLEKIKTIGDAYMVASGLLGEASDHAEHLARLALEMREAATAVRPVQLRIGIDIGPVVAGVVGSRKFSYDLWGDTVNTAARMQAHGIPGAIQVTERAYRRLASSFVFDVRGPIDVKGKGAMPTYLLVGGAAEG